MQRGVAAPILIILFGVLAISLVSLSGIPQKLFPQDEVEDVKGVAAVNSVRSGFSVTVESRGTWDLFEYLCNEDTCSNDLETGKRYTTIGGGATDGHEVVVTYSPEWDQYSHVKLYAKPAWGVSKSTYAVSAPVNLDRVAGELAVDVNSNVQTLLIPIERVKDIFVENLATFSDNQ